MKPFVLLLLSLPLLAQTLPDTVLYGASYYHEYMPEERLETDVALMKKAGFTVVRLGESTWSSWEPRDGEFEFAWMDRILDAFHKAGIRVIMGTPTYSIPPWLAKKHPDILVTRLGSFPPLYDHYMPSYPGFQPPGAYGPRQNMDLTHPEYVRHAERVIRAVVKHTRNHPAIIGFQVDNETGPNGLPLPNVQRQFNDYLKEKYGTPQVLNKLWGFAYWGQLVQSWDEFPARDGILNPGYKLEWERFQARIVTNFLGWQAKIVRELKRPDQFVTHNFVGGIRTNLDQWAIARDLDIVAVNPYHAWQDRFDAQAIWQSGDLNRSLKNANYLVTETNAQTIGWDSRAQYPPYDGQLRLAAYTHAAAGANMVAYWHWHSLHYGQETYWRGVLSHDLEPNRAYAEVSRIGAELKKIGPQIANLRKDNRTAILYSADSYHALQFMPFSDRVSYMTILGQMYASLYRLNIEPDFVTPDSDWSRYKLLLVPPLYSASDATLEKLARFVEQGGRAVVSFKSGFTNEHSTVRHEMAPGPLRKAAGFRYQEFSNVLTYQLKSSIPIQTQLPTLDFPGVPVRISPRTRNRVRERLAKEITGGVWAEFLIPETAESLATYDHPFLSKYPAVTRNRHGQGTLAYLGTYVSDNFMDSLLTVELKAAALAGPDQSLPLVVRVRHGRNPQGKLLHYYLNYSGESRTIKYPYGAAVDLLTGRAAAQGAALTVGSWDLVILAEN